MPVLNMSRCSRTIRSKSPPERHMNEQMLVEEERGNESERARERASEREKETRAVAREERDLCCGYGIRQGG
eukprot:3505976-Rhodomonas_salina.1